RRCFCCADQLNVGSQFQFDREQGKAPPDRPDLPPGSAASEGATHTPSHSRGDARQHYGINGCSFQDAARCDSLEPRPSVLIGGESCSVNTPFPGESFHYITLHYIIGIWQTLLSRGTYS
ncbi:hypothetical protein COCON_G00019580, partial [Conger conger]